MPAIVTIANGASLSGEINLGGAMPGAIIMPAAWTAANLTLQVSPDGGVTYYDLYDDAGNEITITAAASRMILFDTIAQLIAIGEGSRLKIRSGTSGTPVNQGAARTLYVVSVR